MTTSRKFRPYNRDIDQIMHQVEDGLQEDIHNSTLVQDNNSDYGEFGSDIEELEILDHLLAQASAQAQEDTNHASFVATDIEDFAASQRHYVSGTHAADRHSQLLYESSHVDVEVLHHDEAQDTGVRRSYDDKPEERKSPEPAEIPSEPDHRSPLEKYRKHPKKVLSVTDLISPAWCELQYSYTLSKHGRKKRTRAMKQGSAVHQALEDEDHVTIPIEITKTEDSWGLRIWNICQGLKTLRETGRTRELEVWGTIGGEIVNGVIDEVTFECPNPKVEESHDEKSSSTPALPEYQPSITEYLLSEAGAEKSKTRGSTLEEALLDQNHNNRAAYIIDVKTRTSPTLPTGSSIKPTILQLHLYHHMLENLAQGNFHLDLLADRYGLDIHETFSDAFLAQLMNINQTSSEEMSAPHLQDNKSPDATHTSSQAFMDALFEHNNLSLLWNYMLLQFQQTLLLPTESLASNLTTLASTPQSISDLPTFPSQPTRLSPLLTAEYLAYNYKHIAGSRKKSLGRKSFHFNPTFLKNYLEDNLQWWRGQRSARGVELQDAWKCRSCDFRDNCEWIHERDTAAFTEAMERKKMREVAGVEKKITKSKV